MQCPQIKALAITQHNRHAYRKIIYLRPHNNHHRIPDKGDQLLVPQVLKIWCIMHCPIYHTTLGRSTGMIFISP